MVCNLDPYYFRSNNMNKILSVILLLISGVSSQYLQCPKSNGKFPVENTGCKSYYECENGKVTNEITCPDGQSFNPSLQWCDYEELYYCAEKEIEKYKRCKKASGKFPIKNSRCRGYYECEKWKVIGEFTCPPGQNFHPEQQWCDWEELYPCLEDKLPEKCPKPNGFFPKLGSQCKSYYQCINGKAYELQCPDDLIFDSVHSQCEWPELSTCDEMRESSTVETSRVAYTTTQPTSSTEGTSYRTTKEFTTASTERTKSTAKTRTSFTTDSVPTKVVSQSTKTERTIGTTSTTDGRSRSTQTEITDKYTLSSTEGSSGIRTKTTRGTTEDYTATSTEDYTTMSTEDYTTTSTEETSAYSQTEQTAETRTLSTGGTSAGTETTQEPKECITSSPSTAQTRTTTDTFSTSSIRTDRPGDIVCPGANGLFPHPTDETKFLSCLGFIPTVMNCPEGLIFDPAIKRCNWRKWVRI